MDPLAYPDGWHRADTCPRWLLVKAGEAQALVQPAVDGGWLYITAIPPFYGNLAGRLDLAFEATHKALRAASSAADPERVDFLVNTWSGVKSRPGDDR